MTETYHPGELFEGRSRGRLSLLRYLLTSGATVIIMSSCHVRHHVITEREIFHDEVHRHAPLGQLYTIFTPYSLLVHMNRTTDETYFVSNCYNRPIGRRPVAAHKLYRPGRGRNCPHCWVAYIIHESVNTRNGFCCNYFEIVDHSE